MPVYKHLAAQQSKRAGKRKASALDDDAASSAADSGSEQSDAGSVGPFSDEDDSDDDSEDEDSVFEDDGLGGEDGGAELDEDAPRPPPKGFPTALEALEGGAQVVSSLALAGGELDEDDEEELPLVCVVCPNKVLRKGKMTEVHLASKDHKRRLARFAAHVQSADFPAEHAQSDARWVSSQIDKGVIERLSMQTLVGGKKAGTVQPAAAESAAATKGKAKEVQEATPVKPAKGKGKATTTPSKPSAADTPSAASPSKPSNAERKAAAVSAAEAAGRSVREQLRQEKKEKNLRRRERKREKNERIKKRKLDNGEPLPERPPPKRRFVEKVKPTDEEIAARQAWKLARDAAKASGAPIPPRPVLAYEHGGKVPQKVAHAAEQREKAFEAKVAAGAAGGKKGGAGAGAAGGKGGDKAAKRKEKKAARRSKGGEDEVLPEL
ncbi:hypothetical protein Rhopal_006732-T1 [Rhodotorula paludigena]|uniref:U1-type domain-containing protein n=1 Tax=Rhodotorula paludigena TaxID=86838 RepID=A0AAV5GW18_9BASI|nr:hypothetical protein Rhopal_006732-T1 [Rhodotorula paludigena]